VRSLSKELGRKGICVNLLELSDAGLSSLPTALGFLLGTRSAFVTGQVVRLHGVAGRAPELMDAPLAGQVAVVTGGARGIGEQTVTRLAAAGAHVIVVDRPDDAQAIQEVADAVGGTACPVDVRSADAPDIIAQAAGDRGIDIVVHNAGITRDKTLARMRADAWDMVLDINLEAILRIDERLLVSGYNSGARVVLLSSVGGIAGNMGQTNYGASKAGLIGYAAYQANALASRGISVNAVAPGFIETRMTAAMPVTIREAARRLSSLNQGGLPGDVAELITFLSLPSARGISGQTIRVCGGALIGA
jgi:3-oxoacyl-[acyl-carrier protein] reductase